MTTTKTHILSDETGQQLHADLGTTLHADLQALVAAGTTRYDAANAAAANAASTASVARQETIYDLQLLLGTYPGRSLAVIFADEISEYGSDAEWFNARVMAGNFDGIRPFDWFDITLTDGKVFHYRCAAFDPYLHACDTEITAHHVMMVPDQVWPDFVAWNSNGKNQGTSSEKHPYLAGTLHTWMNETFYNLLPQKWKAVIATHRALLEERYSSSGDLNASTGWSWANLGKVWSLSEKEVYGNVVWGTPGYSQGYDCHFDLFFKCTKHRIRRNHNGDRYGWWLRGAHGSSASDACNVTNNGSASNNSVTCSWVRALPCFRVGV